MTEKRETAFQKRMKAFHEAQARNAAARDRAKQKPSSANDDE
ncbi:protein of unknown function [Microbacterium sp. Nx66]|nr:protein of unknown function [Microbacterium sp. Nx66]